MTERQYPIGQGAARTRCAECGRNARRVLSRFSVIIGPNRAADARQKDENSRAMRLSADIAQKEEIELAFAEGDVLDYKEPTDPRCPKPDIDHAKRLGPGKRGVLPPKRKPRDSSKDPFRFRPVKAEDVK